MLAAKMATQEARPEVLQKIPPIAGLCRDCARADTCTFPRDPFRPVWSCDEFDGGIPASSHPRAADPRAAGIRTVAEEPGQATELKGLCRECAHRLTCRYPKRPGGVWHCEELA